MIQITPNEQRVWNRLKNSEEKYRSLYLLQKQQTDSLHKMTFLQTEIQHDQGKFIGTLQEEVRISKRNEADCVQDNLRLTEANTRLSKKAKGRLKTILIAIPIAFGAGYVLGTTR